MALVPILDAVPAPALRWITTSTWGAHRYRTVLHAHLQVREFPHAFVIEDGAAGYLVIRDARNLTQF